jgi:AraC-like DNA-binding protein
MVRNVWAENLDPTPRPIYAVGHDYMPDQLIKAHMHRRCQLLYAEGGAVLVSTNQGAWVMPPQRGLWIPAGVSHEVQMLGVVSTRSLYIEPGAAAGMPHHCQVVEISSFMRGLLHEAVDLPAEYETEGRAGALMTLILHEITRLPALPLSIPFPTHEALARRCRAFLEKPTPHETIDEWAKATAMSRRSFTRLFKRETGLSFALWRQQACLVAALPRLAAGEPVTGVAVDLGYDNPAAFTAMFKRALGSSPREYLKKKE